PSGHMQFLIRALDGDPSLVTAPSLPPLPTAVDDGLLHEAIAFLRRTSVPVEPRKQWPAGGLSTYGVTGKIPEDQQAQPGKALCVWGDAGWGAWVKYGKYEQGHLDDSLGTACVALFRCWAPQPAPNWVPCVPSWSRPLLVPDFARRLAQALGLQFEPVIVKTEQRPEQKTMANSAQQALNVDGSLAISPQFNGQFPDGPCPLAD